MLIVGLRLTDLELDNVVEQVGLEQRGQLRLADFNYVVAQVQLRLHRLELQVHGFKQFVYAAL